MDSASIVTVVASGIILVTLGILIGLLVSKARSVRALSTRSATRSTAQLVGWQSTPPSFTGTPSASPVQNSSGIVGNQSTVSRRGPSGPTVISGSDYLTAGRFRNTEAAQAGRKGEDKVVAEIISALDSRWYVFRNVILLGNTGDLDIVLVGPGGTWVLEVKAYTGNYRVENGKWYKLTSNGRWARNSFGPGAQAIQNAKRLCNYLKANGMTTGVSVNPVVVVAQDTQIDYQSAGTKLWKLPDLPRELAALNRQKYHRQEHVERIAAILSATPTALSSFH